ncbi:hypothetical protein [Nocardioides sp. B-3]|uniref:hypothetical protein n=1 Tax=Nocardioides sp. B-3 TaxID=2895565 RepID=UPI002152C644|nr:hypothetical protein [Nocardioides sp. B-3]UUZ60749.1 hypothetical protein LP418_08240 [Nocardioides sp. B-3]
MSGLGSVGRVAPAFVALVALLVLAAGAAVAALVGSDDTVFNQPAELGRDGRPVLTAPDLLAFEGVTVTLRASAPEGVFIGTAHPVDVADFVGDSSRGPADPSHPHRGRGRGRRVWQRRGAGRRRLLDLLDERNRRRGAHPRSRLDRRPVGDRAGVGRGSDDGLVRHHRARPVPGGRWSHSGVGSLVLLACVELLLRSRRRPPLPQGPSAAERIAAYVPADIVAPTPSRGGKRRARRTALAVVLTLSPAGCTYEDLLPAKRQSSELATTKVALTRAELPALFESYGERLRTAIEAARPPRYRTDAWRRADTGPALESDLFATPVGKQTKLGRRSVPAYVGIEAFSGRFDSYPMWSLVASKEGRSTRVDLFAKEGVSAPRLREAGSIVSRDLPDAGRPGLLPDADRAAAATAAWRDYLRTGDRDDRLAIDRDSKAWRENIADLGGRAMFSGYTVSVEPGGVSRVVSVADGALAPGGAARHDPPRRTARPDGAVGGAVREVSEGREGRAVLRRPRRRRDPPAREGHADVAGCDVQRGRSALIR